MNSSKTLDTDRIQRLSKEGFWIVLGQGMAVLGALIGVRLLTELLDPTAYGEFALGLTIAALISQTILGPLSNGALRFYAPAVENGDLCGYIGAVRSLLLSAYGVVAALLCAAISGLLIVGKAEWIAIVTAAVAYAVLNGSNAILCSIQNAARQRIVVAINQGMESWTRFLLATALMVWVGATSTIAMVGYAISMVMVLLSQYVFFRRPIHRDSTQLTQHNWRDQIWKFSQPFAIFGLFTWVQLVSDRWALELFATTQEVGLYAVLFQLGYFPMSLITGMAVQFLAPIFYQRAGDASDGRRNASVNSLSWRLTGLTLCVTGAAFLVASLFHEHIFFIFVAKEYETVSHLLPWVILSGGIFAAGQTIALNLMSQMKTHTMMAAKIVTALGGLVLNIAGAYWYGTAGIVMAGIAFSVSYFVWIALLSNRESLSFSDK